MAYFSNKEKKNSNVISSEEYHKEIKKLHENNLNFKYLCQLHITYECNMTSMGRCFDYCYQRHQHGKHMSKETFRNIIEKYTPRQIALGGGEPIKHPQFLDLIRYAKLDASIPVKHVNYTTNGLALPESFEQIQKLISGISISIDNLRYPSLFTEGIPHIILDNLKSYVNSPIQVFLNFVVSNKNITDMEKAVELAHQSGMDGIYILGFKDRNGTVPFTVNDFKISFEYALKLAQKYNIIAATDCCINAFLTHSGTCTAGKDILAFDVDGNPFPCSFSEILGDRRCPYIDGITQCPQ